MTASPEPFIQRRVGSSFASTSGRERRATFISTCRSRGVAAWETNLMEVVQSPLSLAADRNVLTVPTNPYEIKTVKVQFAK